MNTSICFINPTSAPKQTIFGLVNHLPSNYQGVILVPSYFKNNLFLDNPNFSLKHFETYQIRSIDYPIFNFLNFVKLLLNLDDQYDFNYIHTSDYFYLTSFMPIIFKIFKHKKIIISVNALPGYSWKFGNKIIDTIAKIYTYLFCRLILSRYDSVFALYKQLFIELTTNFELNDIILLYNGYDDYQISDVSLTKTMIDQTVDSVILYVGRISKVKSIDTILSLSQDLNEQGYEFKTIVIGGGPELDYYRSKVREESYILFTGRLNKKQVYSYYMLASLLVLPSISEGLPNVLLEASSFGVPSIARPINGVPEIILHKKTGFLAKTDREFSKFAGYLLDDNKLRKKLGDQAKKHVSDHFEWVDIITDYEGLLLRLK